MTAITQVTGWRLPVADPATYERLLGALGTGRFGAAVRDAVLACTAGVRRLYLFEATGTDDRGLTYWFGEPGLVDVFPAYRKWYLPVDPVRDAYAATPRCADVAVQRVRPRDIASPGFRRRIFDDAGIVERVSVVQRGTDGWRVMNVARHRAHGAFGDAEIEALTALACLVLPMLPVDRERRAASGPPSVADFEIRFAERHPALTPRERQVCARAAAGLDVEATAAALGIAKTSVLTYRKRAYERLGVASAAALTALVSH